MLGRRSLSDDDNDDDDGLEADEYEERLAPYREAAVVSVAARLYVEMHREKKRSHWDSRRSLARACVRAVLKSWHYGSSRRCLKESEVSRLVACMKSPAGASWPGVEALERRARESCRVLEHARQGAQALEEEMRLAAARVEKAAETERTSTEAAAASRAALEALNATFAKNLADAADLHDVRCLQLRSRCEAATAAASSASVMARNCEAEALKAHERFEQALSAHAKADCRALDAERRRDEATEAADVQDERCARASLRAAAALAAADASERLTDAQRDARLMRDEANRAKDAFLAEAARRDRLAADLRTMERSLKEARSALEVAREAAAREQSRLEDTVAMCSDEDRALRALIAEQTRLKADIDALRRHRSDLAAAARRDERRQLHRLPLEDHGLLLFRSQQAPSRSHERARSTRLTDDDEDDGIPHYARTLDSSSRPAFVDKLSSPARITDQVSLLARQLTESASASLGTAEPLVSRHSVQFDSLFRRSSEKAVPLLDTTVLKK